MHGRSTDPIGNSCTIFSILTISLLANVSLGMYCLVIVFLLFVSASYRSSFLVAVLLVLRFRGIPVRMLVRTVRGRVFGYRLVLFGAVVLVRIRAVGVYNLER